MKLTILKKEEAVTIDELININGGFSKDYVYAPDECASCNCEIGNVNVIIRPSCSEDCPCGC